MKRFILPLRKLPGAGALLALVAFGFAGCTQSTQTPPTAAAASPTPSPTPASASVTPNSFADVTAQLDAGGDLYLYLSTAAWLGHLSQSVDTLRSMASSAQGAQKDEYFGLLKDAIQKSGIEQLTGFGASSLNYATGLYRNKLFIHHYPADGSGLIWSLYGTAPHGFPGMDFLPANTALGGVGDFDIAGMINFVRQEIKQSGDAQLQQQLNQSETQFAGLTGLQLDDVLASLNGAVGMVLTLDASNSISVPSKNGQMQTIPYPRLAILIAVKNDLIFKQADKMLAGTDGIARVDEPGLIMRSMHIPAVPYVSLHATMAQWNGYLVLATDDKLVREMDATLKGGPGLKSTAEYALLSAGLPQQGNRFLIMTDSFAKLQGQLLSQGSPSDFSGALNRHFQHPGHFMAVTSVLANGLLTVTQGSQGSNQLIPPLMIAPAVAMAAIISMQQRGVFQGFHLGGSPAASNSSSPAEGQPANPPPTPAASP